MKRDIDWSVVFLFIVAALFFVLGVSMDGDVMLLFISGFYFMYGFSVSIIEEIKTLKKEIMDELKKLK